jgi:hypothetical protein
MELFVGTDAVLGLTQCIHISPEFSKATPFNLTEGPLPLALYDSSSCPDSLGLSEEAYAKLFRGKVAVWLSYIPSDISCDPLFYHPANWYLRMLDAGALGVITFVPMTGHEAGTFYDSFDRTTLFETTALADVPEHDYIPFLMCAQDEPDRSGIYSQQALTTFLDNWYALPSDRAAPFDNSTGPVLIGNVIITPNPWIELYSSSYYVVAFRVATPLLFMYIAASGFFYALERFANTTVAGSSLAKTLSPPLCALIIEAVSTLMFGLFMAMDGWGSNLESTVVDFRYLFIGGLMMVTASSSMLVGLTFKSISDSHQLASKVHKTVLGEYRVTLIVGAVLALGVEVFGVLARNSMPATMWKSMMMISMGLSLLVGVWFLHEARGFARILHGMGRSVRGLNTGANELRTTLLNVSFYGVASSIALFIIVSVGSVGVLHPYAAFRTENWTILWFVFFVARGIHSLAKVRLCRIPKSKRRHRSRALNSFWFVNRGKISMTPTAKTDVSDVVNSAVKSAVGLFDDESSVAPG